MRGSKTGGTLDAPPERTDARSASEGSPRAETSKPVKTGRNWAPRMWQGMEFFAWLRLAARNGLHVSWTHAYMPVVITIVSFVHTVLRLVERIVYGRRVARTEIREAPIFI